MSSERILPLLKNVHQASPTQWYAVCPAHDDNKRSLGVSFTPSGKALICCYAGCKFSDILRAANIPVWMAFGHKREYVPYLDPFKGIVTAYDYCDESGTLLYQVVRFDPKDFRQRRPDGKGDWIWGLDKKARRVLYRLPEILKTPPEQAVYIAEGEKDVESLVKRGFVATCNPGGGSKGKSKWLPEFSECLAGRNVVILPDNDETGVPHAESVAKSLLTKRAKVKILRVSGPGVKDVSDWFEAGHTAEELRTLEAASPALAPNDEPSHKEALPAEPTRPAYESIIAKLGVVVLGIDDRSKLTVAILDSSGNKVSVNPAALRKEHLVQIVGPGRADKFLDLGDDGGGSASGDRVNLPQAKDAIARASSGRFVDSLEQHGDGVWSDRTDGTLTLVQRGEVWNFSPEGDLQPGGIQFDDGRGYYDVSGVSWFRADDVRAFAAAAREGPLDFCRKAIASAVELFSRWDNWKYPDSPDLLASLLPVTWLQSVWRIRPFVGITGDSNTGKSSLKTALSRIFGNLQGSYENLTEASLRIMLRGNSKFAFFDEFEANKGRQRILDTLRAGSTGGKAARSSRDNTKLVETNLHHVVWCAAKELGLTEAADVNRFISFELTKLPDGRGSRLVVPPSEELRSLGLRLLVAGMMHWRQVQELADRLGRAPCADNDRRFIEYMALPVAMGAILKGESLEQTESRLLHAVHLRSRDVVIAHDDDELVQAIWFHTVPIGRGDRASIGQLIESVIKDDTKSNCGFEAGGPRPVLEQVGIKLVGRLKSEQKLFLHPPTISKLLDPQGGRKDIRRILLRLPGAEPAVSRLSGRTAAGVCIPVTGFTQDEENGDNAFI